MGKKRMLTEWIKMLELTHKDAQDAIRQVIGMIEQLDRELAKPENVEQVEAHNNALYEADPVLTITTRMKPELMVMSKIPALSIDVNCSKKMLDSARYWLVQVVCAEHQNKWELAICTEGKKRGRTEFTTDLILPVQFSEDPERGCWVATLPAVQLNHEQGIKELDSRECYFNSHRFQFRICLLNENHDPVSSPTYSSTSLLATYTSGRSVDQYILKQAQNARRITSHIREKEIHERVQTTKIFLLEERKHILPKVSMVHPSSIITPVSNAEFTPIKITGQYFHRPNIVRIDSECDDVDILKQSIVSSTSSVCASVKVPLYPGSWMLKVRNFDDPNLDSEDYLRLNFQNEEPKMDTSQFSDFEDLTPLFTLDSDCLSMPSHYSMDVSRDEQKLEDILLRYRQICKSKFSSITPINSFVDRSTFHYHIMNGFTHTVAAMLNSVDSPHRHALKKNFGAVPAMLSLLSENPCTVILCLCLYFFEQREFTHAEFKRFLSYILCADRAIPLHPHMMLDFLENEIGFDARIRFMKAAIIFSENFLAGDEDLMSGDDCSPLNSDEEECNSTSDEDYEDPPVKILKSSATTPGGPIKISIKIEQAKDGCFAHISSPPPPASAPSTLTSTLSPLPPTSRAARSSPSSSGDSDLSSSSLHECEWEKCLVCDRDIPIMLQTQNPTWAAIMRVVFYSFMQIFPETEYWKVRQAYKYIEDHWEKLCPGKTQGVGAWRKQLQDALSHNKQYFISGMHIYGQKGYWGLKQIIDPWAITDEVDFPKRAYNHQPRRGRPPKGNARKKGLKKKTKRILD